MKWQDYATTGEVDMIFSLSQPIYPEKNKIRPNLELNYNNDKSDHLRI